MEKKKPLLPAQRRFLEYILVRNLRTSPIRYTPVLNQYTEDRIRRVLKNDEYLPSGLFNTLRSDYIKDFHEFEQSTKWAFQ